MNLAAAPSLLDSSVGGALRQKYFTGSATIQPSYVTAMVIHLFIY